MPERIRIATYNIHGGKGTDGVHDYRRINRFLKEQKIDIALLQEVETRHPDRNPARDLDDLCGSHFNWHVAAPAMYGKNGWYGNAILSRYPVIDSSIVDISMPLREPRNMLDSYIETPHGLLRVINTHKGLKRKERLFQLKMVIHELEENKDIPLIFGGDFNDWQPVFSIIRVLNEELKQHPAGATWPSRYPLMHLDRIWSRPDTIVKKVMVLKTPETKIYSDHLPVLAEIEHR